MQRGVAVGAAVLVGNLLVWLCLIIWLPEVPTEPTFPSCLPRISNWKSKWTLHRSHDEDGSHAFAINVRGARVPVANISLVIGMLSTDYYMIPIVLESVSKQVVKPLETLLVVNFDVSHEGGEQILHANQVAVDGTNRPVSSSANFLEHLLSSYVANATRDVPDGALEVLKNAAPLDESLWNIPNFRIIAASNVTTAGGCRDLGGKSARTPIVTFFDVDDYMHPQRIQTLEKVFNLFPSLEAVLHEYLVAHLATWTRDKEKFSNTKQAVTDDFRFQWNYKDIWEALPHRGPHDEPNVDPLVWKWWFPINMSQPLGVERSWPVHNGWLTLRRKVLFEVEYPVDLVRGQDSLYVWRLIDKKRNFNILPHTLGVYLQPGGGVGRRNIIRDLEQKNLKLI